MNKFSKVALMMIGLAAGAKAQSLVGLGYDTDLSQITARLSLGANALDLGAGLNFDNGAPDDAKFQMLLSGFFLGHLHDWGPVDTYLSVGGIFEKLAQKNDNAVLAAFVGFQPEVTLLDHIVVSTRFGLRVPLVPDLELHTTGNGISIVNGANFKILF
ncbi:MAG: hypothetical protein ABIW76_14760 [Fibrobacteria bacterium]